ncbi:hypothetical protein [Sporosarcina sp. OR05]|uniref:hypothetical protein n=1 Tax=Sporosarcina sp. OR05 TaxID=2969819 RepID=UPI00352AAF14
MFPYELEGNNRVNRLSLKKLSKYIELDNQKLYFSLNLINLIIYLVFVFYGLLLFIKYQNTETLTKVGELSDWVKKQDSISLFNGVTLFSLMIAIYTITFPIQNKIIDEAEQKLNEKKKVYY